MVTPDITCLIIDQSIYTIEQPQYALARGMRRLGQDLGHDLGQDYPLAQRFPQRLQICLLLAIATTAAAHWQGRVYIGGGS